MNKWEDKKNTLLLIWGCLMLAPYDAQRYFELGENDAQLLSSRPL